MHRRPIGVRRLLLSLGVGARGSQAPELSEDQRFVLQYDQPLHDVLELADVARPFVREQSLL